MIRRGGLAVLATVLVTGCGEERGPAPGSEAYEEAVGEFHIGVAALQVGEDVRAERSLTRFAELAPDEPAAGANLAILALQQRRLDDAARWVERAFGSGRPDDPELALVGGLVERERGRLDQAIDRLRPATAGKDPDPRVTFLFHDLLEQRGEPGDAGEAGAVLEAMVERDPDNAFLRVESVRRAVRHSDEERLAHGLEWLEDASEDWPEALRQQLREVTALEERPGELGSELTFLAAQLEAEPWYAEARAATSVAPHDPDLVVTRFRRLAAPSPRPPEPDLEMDYTERVVGEEGEAEADLGGGWLEAHPVWVEEADNPSTVRVAVGGAGALALAGGGEPPERLPVPESPPGRNAGVTVATFDHDANFRMDLAVAGRGGLRILVQDEEGGFRSLGPGALPDGVRDRAYTAVWAADADVDGDVDLILAPEDAPPFLLRNRADGTFEEVARFEGVTEPARFAWGDLDRDGVPDAVFLDGDGSLHVQLNPRQDHPVFQPVEVPDRLQPARAVTLGDMDGDGLVELLVLRQDGVLLAAELGPLGWETRQVGTWPTGADGAVSEGTGPGRLFVADLDNNGALGVVASVGGRTHTWLADSDYELVPHRTLSLETTAVADLGRGRVELLGVDEEGRPLRLTPAPTRNYYALTLSPRATEGPGDGRINSFGVGGEAEIRAGMLYQKQRITDPYVHFGLGEHTGASVARILWPNGTAQAEFDLLATSEGEPIVAEQRLKGSCPWLFAHDGEGMTFVTDLAWRTALGLRINTYGSASVIQSQDWVRLRGDQLEPRDGVYELSITADLWESHFFDYVALDVVDHPAGTRALVDERFQLPPPELEVRQTGPLQPLHAARDQRGRDVLPVLSERDGRYVDGFELGPFQGVTAEEHYVEVDLGPDTPVDAPLLLVADGWVFPTDGSTNFSLGKGDHQLPRGVRVEVPDGEGGWRVLHEDLGMPAGKTKTMLVDLEGAFLERNPRRVRLATTMEIYWDRITWAEALPEAEREVTRLHPTRADLRPRGFSRAEKPDRRSPEIPEWEVQTTSPQWRDLEGFYTRFGDVLPLLEEIDDRYVIMNAGDELRLEFEALPDPPEGWVRSYVFVSEAWVKDGDFNNGFSGTLRPLPYHGMTDYDAPPGPLRDEPAYQRHPDDWREYHTRYVSGEPFDHVLSSR